MERGQPDHDTKIVIVLVGQVEHGGMGGNEVLQQVLQRAILLEASLKDMTAQRDKWVLQADYWKEQAQHAQRQLAPPTIPASTESALAPKQRWWQRLRSMGG
jgi:hypothetical protein